MTHRIVPLGTNHTPRIISFLSGSFIVDDDARIVAFTPKGVVAERVAELLDRYGLLDIPDNLAAEVEQ